MKPRPHQEDVNRWPTDDLETDDLEYERVSAERISRHQKTTMPVASGRSADRSSKKTAGSRKAKKMVSQKSGGIHRRRQKRIQ